MATIKAGTYRFNDVLSVPSNNISADFDFTVSPYALQLTQEMADGIYLEYGVTIDAGTYIITYHYDGLGWRYINNVDGISPYLNYDNQIAKSSPYNPYIETFLSDTATEFYEVGSGWSSDIGEDNQTITIPNDTEVSEEFYTWFNANAVQLDADKPLATITYNGETIATLDGGQSATLKCAGMKMESDVVVEVAEVEQGGGSEAVIVPLTVTENGVYDSPYEVGTETWDSNTEYVGSVTVDGVTLSFKKAENLIVPDDLSELAKDKYRYQFYVNGYDDYWEEGGIRDRIDGVEGVYATLYEYAVLWVKNATLLNAQLGISFLEDNTVYITNFLQLYLAQHGETFEKMSVFAPVGKIDGYFPVTVDVKMEAISGAWTFNTDTVDIDANYKEVNIPLDSKYNRVYDVHFSCVYNGETKNCVKFFYDLDDRKGGIFVGFMDADNNIFYLIRSGGAPSLEDNISTTIDFGSDPQAVHPLFKELMVASATQQQQGGGGALPDKVVYYNNMNGTEYSTINVEKQENNAIVNDFEDLGLWADALTVRLLDANQTKKRSYVFQSTTNDNGFLTCKSLTVGGWFKTLSGVLDFERFMWCSGSALFGIYRTKAKPTTMQFDVGGTGETATYKIVNDVWFHLALSLEENNGYTQITVYVNGEIINTYTRGYTMDMKNVAISHGTYCLNGYTKNIFASKGALTQEEIRQMMLRD